MVEAKNPAIQDASGKNWDVAAINATDELASRPQSHGQSDGAASTLDFQIADRADLHLGLGVSTSTDLSEADLHGADLRRAELEDTNLRKSDLRGARLENAKLARSDLRGADLRAARLASADVSEAKFYGALFDQWTELPFSKQEALKRGMIYLELDSPN